MSEDIKNAISDLGQTFSEFSPSRVARPSSKTNQQNQLARTALSKSAGLGYSCASS